MGRGPDSVRPRTVAQRPDFRGATGLRDRWPPLARKNRQRDRIFSPQRTPRTTKAAQRRFRRCSASGCLLALGVDIHEGFPDVHRSCAASQDWGLMDGDHGLALKLDASVLQFDAHAFLADGFQQAGPNPAMNVDGQAGHAVRKRGPVGNLCASLVVLGVLCGKKSRSHNRFVLASWGASDTNRPRQQQAP